VIRGPAGHVQIRISGTVATPHVCNGAYRVK
jgi:hypothetical protein